MSPIPPRAASPEPIPGLRHRLFRDGPVRRRIEAVIPGEAVAAALTKELQRIRRRARVPGFRRGRVPMTRIAHTFGEQAAQAISRRLVERASREILEPLEESPVAPPVSRIADLPRPFSKADLRFELRFEVVPEFGPLDLSGIEVTPPRTEIGEEHIQETLDQIRRTAAEPGPLGSAGIRDHDIVVGDLEETEAPDLNARPSPDAPSRTTTDVPIRVGSGDYHPGLHETLQGARVGDTVVTTVRFAPHSPDPDRAGRTLRVLFTIRDGRTPVLPPADDALARKVGADSLLALRGDIRDRLRERAEREDRDQLRRMLLDAVRERNPFEVPEALVELETRRSARQYERQLLAESAPGSGPERRQLVDEAMREHLPKLRESVARTVADVLLLDAVVREHNIEAPPEAVEEAIAEIAEAEGKTPPAVRARLERFDRLAEVEQGQRRRAAVEFLLAQVTLNDPEKKGTSSN